MISSLSVGVRGSNYEEISNTQIAVDLNNTLLKCVTCAKFTAVMIGHLYDVIKRRLTLFPPNIH